MLAVFIDYTTKNQEKDNIPLRVSHFVAGTAAGILGAATQE